MKGRNGAFSLKILRKNCPKLQETRERIQFHPPFATYLISLRLNHIINSCFLITTFIDSAIKNKRKIAGVRLKPTDLRSTCKHKEV